MSTIPPNTFLGYLGNMYNQQRDATQQTDQAEKTTETEGTRPYNLMDMQRPGGR